LRRLCRILFAFGTTVAVYIRVHLFDRWRTLALRNEWKVEHGRFVARQSTWLRKLFWAKYV